MGEDIYDIIIRDEIPEKETEEEAQEKAQKEKTVDDLRAIRIENANGGMHNLEDISSLNYGRGRSRIIRVNQDKQIEVYYAFPRDVQSSKDLLGGYRSDIDQLIASYNLPSGVAVQVFHEEDEFGDFKFLILATFLLIFMILASVFESVVTPFVLLFTIPLAAIGSLLALLLSSNSLMNANTLTGFLILLGVVVNNGIILIDYANILRKRGYRRNRALMTAGMSRIRPILIYFHHHNCCHASVGYGRYGVCRGYRCTFCHYSDRRTFFFRHADADFNSDSLYGTGKCASVVPFVIP